MPARHATNDPGHVILDIEIRAESGKAWCIYDGSRTVWVPKSQAEIASDQKTMIIPEWLAFEKGLI